MATQYTDILKLALPVQGELSGTWGDVVNDNITSMVEEAIAGRKVINTWTTNSHTLTTADGVTSESRAAILSLTDTGAALTGAGTVICPAESKIYIVENGTGQTITVKTSSGTGVAVPDGDNMLVFCDGTNVQESITNINSLALNGTEITATATELNLLDGVTATTAELNFVDGVTSNIQTQLDAKAPTASPTFTGTMTASGLAYPTADGTANQVMTTDGAGTLSFTTVSSGGISAVVDDTTPQLGGNLDVNGNSIVSASNGNIAITPDGTGTVSIDGLTYPSADGTNGQVLTTNGTGTLSFADAGGGLNGFDTSAYTGSNGIFEYDLVASGTTPQLLYSLNTSSSPAAVPGSLTAHQVTYTISTNQIFGFVDAGGFRTKVYNRANGTTASTGLVLEGPTNTDSGVEIIGNVKLSSLPTTDPSETGLLWNDGGAVVFSGSTAGISAVVDDTTPQLGGNLDVNGNSIVSASNGNIAITPDGTGTVSIDGLTYPSADGTNGQVLTTNGAGTLSFADAGGGFDPNVDNPAIGNGSSATGLNGAAYGHDSSAGGQNSVAYGYTASAGGQDSTALGSQTVASATHAVAVGHDADATAADAIAVGAVALASGSDSIAIGRGTTSNKTGSIAIGEGCASQGAATIMIGDGAATAVDAVNGVGIGRAAQVLGNYGVAIGDSSGADAANTIHINASGVTTNQPQTAGHMVIETDDAKIEYSGNWDISGGTLTLGAVTYPNTDGTAGQVLQTDGAGNLSFATAGGGFDPNVDNPAIGNGSSATGLNGAAYGHDAVASGNDSTALGNATDATALGATAVGAGAQATGTYSVALGEGNASAANAISIGVNSDATNTAAIAIGNITNALGANSIAIGDTASIGSLAANATAVGSDTLANGANSTAIGDEATVTQARATAVGYQCDATAEDALALGNRAVASGASSVAAGVLASASATYGVAIGQQSSVTQQGGVSIGFSTQALTGVAIGDNAHSTSGNAIAIGDASVASGTNSVAVGQNTDATQTGAVAVGTAAQATGLYGVALGEANAAGANSVSIGVNSDALFNEAIAIGSNSGADAANTIHINASGVTTNQPQTAGHMVIETDDARFQYGTNGYSWFFTTNEEMRLTSAGDLLVDGNVTAYSTTISDRRLKSDITNISNALDKVGQINGVTFVRDHNGDKAAGVVAQEIMEVLPEAVKSQALPLQTGTDDEYYVVEYDAVTGLLVEAVKELKARVEALEAE